MDSILLMVLVFVVISSISYVLISKVPQRLHTPLMAFSNAISAVTILGAILLFAENGSALERLLGGLAITAAAFNMIGGFVVTDRMVRMFRGRSVSRGGDRG
ncbi:MAG: NAD(P) transhydrogenase subunit alpha [Coriobacteriia bacterium]|nr:NAD(P) transhydrogenase subunit alpha [Coriobacteriia bacterium]